MSLVGVVVMPPAVLTVRKLMKRVRNITLTQFGGGADILKAMQETVQGFKIIKAFNLEDVMRAQVYEQHRVDRACLEQARPRLQSFDAPDGSAGRRSRSPRCCSSAATRCWCSNAPPGEFISFITAFILAYEPAKRIARFNIDLQNGLIGVQILFEVLDLPTEPPASRKPDIALDRGRIEFDDVSFAYRPGEPGAARCRFTAAPGGVTAFVGPSGGGKSTIFNLLLGLYTPEAGAVRIDGQD